jgi:phosphoglycerate dehydrogenase-like enzyme
MKPERIFTVRYTGDLSGVDGKPVGDLGQDILAQAPFIRWNFLEEQQPKPGDATYQDRLYSMEIKPEHVATANAIVTCRPYVRASAFAGGADGLLAIARAGIGYDKIDLEACTANDVVVFNTPHGMTHATASAAMILILCLSRHLPLQLRMIRERRWDLQKEAVGDDLAGLTLSIIGLGRTGLELARLMQPFGMRLIAFSKHADPAKAAELNIELVGTLEEALRRADYVSLHGRLDNRTRGMIGAKELALLKPTANFVNVARGEMVDEPELIRVLREHRIAGAGLDVFEHEPLPADSPLLQLDNVILTPHWLCSTRQAGRASITTLMNSVVSVARGGLPENILNPAVLDRPGFQRKLQRQREA